MGIETRAVFGAPTHTSMSSVNEQLDRIQELSRLLGPSSPDISSSSGTDGLNGDDCSSADELSSLRAHLLTVDAQAVAERRASEQAILAAYGAVTPMSKKKKASGISVVQPLSGVTLSTPFIHPEPRLRQSFVTRPSFAKHPSFAAQCLESFHKPAVTVKTVSELPVSLPRKLTASSASPPPAETKEQVLFWEAKTIRLKHLRERERVVDAKTASLQRMAAALRAPAACDR